MNNREEQNGLIQTEFEESLLGVEEVKPWGLTFEEISKYSNIYIYGAGRGANLALAWLRNNRVPETNIESFVVSGGQGNTYFIQHIHVITLEQMGSIDASSVILIATKEDKQEEIIKNLSKKGINNICRITDQQFEKWENSFGNTAYEGDFRYKATKMQLEHMIVAYQERGCSDSEIRRNVHSYLRGDGMAMITRLVVVLGTKCSLRCRDCNNLMNHFKPQFDIDENQILQALKNLLSVVDGIVRCELIGGEPFLAKNFTPILDFCLSNEKIWSVETTTNGTVMPSEGSIKLLQHEKMVVRISDYGELVDKHPLIEYLQNRHIKYTLLELGEWMVTGDVTKRGRDEKELKKIYENCTSAYWCKALFRDKMFVCPRAASLYELGYMKEKEYLCIDENLSREALRRFLFKDIGLACDYCDVALENAIVTQPAIQEKRPGKVL